MLRWEARDEGRSLDYDAEERNEADGHFVVQTRRGAAFRAICFVACLAKGVDHSLRPASRISSRKGRAAAPRGFSTACYIQRRLRRLGNRLDFAGPAPHSDCT